MAVGKGIRFSVGSGRWLRSGLGAGAVAISTLIIVPVIPTLSVALSSSPALAQTHYPTARDPYLNDDAQLLSPEDASHIRQSFAALEAQQGIEAVVVTINALQDYGVGDSTIEPFATQLFNTWGIGNAEKNNGILVLVAVTDRKVRIEVGSGYGSTLDAAMQSVIDEYMVPRFKQNDYSGGLRNGTDAIIRRVTQSEALSQTAYSTASPTIDGQSNQTRGAGYWSWIVGGMGVAGAAGLGIKPYLRYRHRRCRDCGNAMVRLDQASHPQYLEAGQNTEQQIGSVAYDVWQCQHCQQQNINHYDSVFSDYKPCKECGYKTMLVKRLVLCAATASSSGSAEVRETCEHCSYQNVYMANLPRKRWSVGSSGGYAAGHVDPGGFSSGGGGGSFGGGSSSGDGASGDW